MAFSRPGGKHEKFFVQCGLDKIRCELCGKTLKRRGIGAHAKTHGPADRHLEIMRRFGLPRLAGPAQEGPRE